MTKTIDCVECGKAVPYGRLSCPRCGALLASVSGSSRSPGGSANEPAGRTDGPMPFDGPNDDVGILPTGIDVGTPTHWPVSPDEAPILVPRAYGREAANAVGAVPVTPPPGAYRPPTLAVSTGSRVPDWPSVAAAGGVAGMAGTGSLDGGRSNAAGVLGSTTLDHARLVEIAGWFVVIGSAMAVLGFVLPWSVVVIGAKGTGGYLDDWGLAGSNHLLVLAGLLIVLALGVIQTPVPAWLKTGLLGLGMGALTFGMLWPYVIGPLGADIGAIVAAMGAVALVIGGVVASWSSRHVEAGPPV